jgi:hypothetical protein
VDQGLLVLGSLDNLAEVMTAIIEPLRLAQYSLALCIHSVLIRPQKHGGLDGHGPGGLQQFTNSLELMGVPAYLGYRLRPDEVIDAQLVHPRRQGYLNTQHFAGAALLKCPSQAPCALLFMLSGQWLALGIEKNEDAPAHPVDGEEVGYQSVICNPTPKAAQADGDEAQLTQSQTFFLALGDDDISTHFR